MTIDLSKLKAGDSVKLRCGGVVEIIRVDSECIYIDDYWWIIRDAGLKKESHPFDVIEAIPKPEPVVHIAYVAMLPKLCLDDDIYRELNDIKRDYSEATPIFKITLTDGEPTIEKVTA